MVVKNKDTKKQKESTNENEIDNTQSCQVISNSSGDSDLPKMSDKIVLPDFRSKVKECNSKDDYDRLFRECQNKYVAVYKEINKLGDIMEILTQDLKYIHESMKKDTVEVEDNSGDKNNNDIIDMDDMDDIDDTDDSDDDIDEKQDKEKKEKKSKDKKEKNDDNSDSDSSDKKKDKKKEKNDDKKEKEKKNKNKDNVEESGKKKKKKSDKLDDKKKEKNDDKKEKKNKK